MKRDSHLEESDNISLASSLPGGTKGLKERIRQLEKLKETEGAKRKGTEREAKRR